MASRGEPWCNSKALLPYDLEVVGLNLGNNLSLCRSKTVLAAFFNIWLQVFVACTKMDSNWLVALAVRESFSIY